VARDQARQIAKTAPLANPSRRRKKVEMLFTHLQEIMRLDRLHLRGPNGAKAEFLLAAIAQSLSTVKQNWTKELRKMLPH
jgi:hypothetical protein